MSEQSREIGGYLELEHFEGTEYHEGALALDCARNCLAYLVEARRITRLWVPEFLCASVDTVCVKHKTEVLHYPICATFEPDYAAIDLGKDDYLYLVDYYGQLGDEAIAQAAERSGGRLIVDEVMAFFRKPQEGLDTIYSCRKFFGVADGGYLYTNARVDRELEQAQSHDKMGFVLGRCERPANDFYPESAANNSRFIDEPVRLMSPITHNILRAVDYEAVAAKRRANFERLAVQLDGMNELAPVATDGAFMYPLLIEGGQQVRKQLQQRRIYVSTLWPYATEREGVAGRYARDILPMVVDQRYDAADMDYQVSTLHEILGK